MCNHCHNQEASEEGGIQKIGCCDTATVLNNVGGGGIGDEALSVERGQEESSNAAKRFHVLRNKLELKLFSLLKTPLLYQLVFPFAPEQL